MAASVSALGRMEVDVPPEPVPGIADALAALSERHKLRVISDAIVTPGEGLRELLEGHGLKRFFPGFAFSDEVGRSKPHRRVFECAARQLGVEVSEMIHVGDRDRNDAKGTYAIRSSRNSEAGSTPITSR